MPASWLLVAAILAAGLVAWASRRFLRIAAVGAAYKAKVLCSGLFVSERTLGSILSEDVSADSYRILRLFRPGVDLERRRVTCSFLGIKARTAVFRPGLGATLAIGVRPENLRPASLPAAVEAGKAAASDADWPAGERSAPEARGAVDEALSAAFSERDPARLARTRAVVVVQDGRLAAERYAPGFGPATPLPGWSMTKSVLNALVGVLVGRGLLSLDRRNLLPEWSSPGDPRGRISLEDLLRMRSGLEFAEVYTDPLRDATQMLFASGSTADYAAAKPLCRKPGTAWQYSSGTSNILSRVCRKAVEETGEDWLSLPCRALFGPLGMGSAVLEPDAAGDFVFSSFMLAVARDWARFGQLVCQDGMWDGRRLLPEGWISWSVTATPQSPEGRYGAGWWLKIPKELGGETAAARAVPPDAFHAIGHEGQVLTVIPSLRLVTVRLGMSIFIDAWDHAAFLAALTRQSSSLKEPR
ncbi:MAG: serine hydrolase [Elusimicrobia bacterium]|nr:serine hydrolase [Elusimicrobiota bacterium]